LVAAQTPTYYGNIEAIIQSNCVTCHHEGGLAPFSLETYGDVTRKGDFIAHVTESKYMPPWKADLSFQSYKNERSLTDGEISAIQQWVNTGMPKGKRTKSKAAPQTLKNQVNPDLTLSMDTEFKIPNTSVEEFRFFCIPTNLDRDVYLSGVDFVPGNICLLTRYLR
jgi:hypothetical protein